MMLYEMHTYIVYPMKGADITIKANDIHKVHENGYTIIEFYNKHKKDEDTVTYSTVATFNLNNIVGFERIG